MAAKNKSMNMSNQQNGGEMGAFTEDEANKKRLRRENGVIINLKLINFLEIRHQRSS